MESSLLRKFNLWLLKRSLKKDTGHELIEPANQYCKHCGQPMFIGNNAREKCAGKK